MSTKKSTKVVQSMLQNLPENTVIEYIKKTTTRSNQEKVKVQRVFRATKPLQVSYAQTHSQLKIELNSYGEDVFEKEQLQTLLNTLTPIYEKGDEFQNVQEFEKITFTDDDSFTQEVSQLQIEKGIVYLVDIWDASSESCQLRMEQNQQMSEKNSQWKGKVSIIGLSINYTTGFVTQKINSFKWKQLQHYRFINGWHGENPLIQYLQLKETPFILLINKQGRIDYLGHPSETNLEARINELISIENNEAQYAKTEQVDTLKPQELLTIEEFKELKQKFNNIQSALKEAQFEGIVKFVLEKVSYWKQNGPKQIHKRSKIVLRYDLDVKEEGKINSFLENHWNKIPDNLKTIKKFKTRDPVRQIKEIQTIFQQTYAALGVNIFYPQLQNIELSYNAKNYSSSVTKSQKFALSVNNMTADQYKTGQKCMREFIDKFENVRNPELNITLEVIQEGLKRNVILPLKTIKNGDQKNIKLQSINLIKYSFLYIGHIRVLYVNPKLNSTSLYSNKMLKNGVKLLFIALSIPLAEDAKEFMENNFESSNQIDFYFPKEQEQSDITQYWAVYFPHCVVVDKFGTIRNSGDVEITEQLVEELIYEQASSEKSQTKELNISQDSVDKVLEILQNAETYEKLKVPSLDVFCRDYQLETVDSVLNQIYQLIPENDWEINKTVSKTFSVPYPGLVCSICNKNITNEPQQYYSPFKKVHLCVECAEFDDKTKKGSERFKCTDNLVFINGPLADLSVLENIDDHKIGKNLLLDEDQEEWNQCPNIICNGCQGFGKDLIGPRYIAVSAKPGKYRREGYIDYCQNCFVELKNKESEKAQAIVQKDSADGMVKDSLFVRILYNHGSYFSF